MSFGFFVVDQARGASDTQQATVEGNSHPELPAVHGHKQPRRFVEGVAHALLSPFAFLAPSGRWPARLVTTVAALLVYAFGLGFLARAAKTLP